MSSSLDPDQAGHFCGSDLGSNCLQELPADDTDRQRVKHPENVMGLDATNPVFGVSDKAGLHTVSSATETS